MQQILFMFIMTPGTASYINAIADAVHRFDVDEIVFINIINSNSGDDQIDFVRFVRRVLPETVEYLLKGIYRDIRPDGQHKDNPAPNAENFEAYQKMKIMFDSSYHIETVNYESLKSSIEKLTKKYSKAKDDIILDITGVSKRVGIDILTASLAVGISAVTLFELKKPPEGEKTLYHKLSPGDFDHHFLPEWGPLLGNIDFFVARQNRQKLTIVVISIFVSILFVIAEQISQTKFGPGSWITWLLVAAIAVIGIVGGVGPIIDAWGGISSFKKSKN